jgi:predicted PP-loop superfamily ATPase
MGNCNKMVEKKVMNNIRNCTDVVVVVAREKAAATAAA